MTELIMKMVLCLIVALLLGLIIGWMLSKIAQSKKYQIELDVLSNTLEDRNKRLGILEKQFAEKEKKLLDYTHENSELKESLVMNSNKLMDTEKKLKSQEEAFSSNLNFQEENEKLLAQVTQFKNEAESKRKELEELETVLVKAEKTIENKSDLLSDNNDDKLNSKIEELENELKLYMTNGEEDEFIVSKDQFTHIEEQLTDYQKEIKILKEENSRLSQLSASENFIDNSKSNDAKNMDDIAIVKLFRETYKKITKS